MKCLDDCHTYALDAGPNPHEVNLYFYRMGVDGHTDSGTTNEELLEILIHRLKYLNEKWMNGRFNCRENSIAITKLEEALMWLEKRTVDRIRRGVEGTHNK